MSLQSQGRNTRPLAVGIILLAAALPLPLLGQSLWLDEASSVWFARLPLADLLLRLCDPHPPGYYLLLKGWLALGEAEPWLRLPSLLASVAAVALTARAGSRIAGTRAGVLAALLLATFPLQSWYAAEVRMYALAQALGAALLLPAWRLMSPPSKDGPGAERAERWALAGFWLIAVVALVVDVSAVLPYAALQLWWLARGRPRAARWLGLQAAVIVPIAIWWLAQGVGGDTYHAIFVAVQARRLGVMLDPASAGQLLRALSAAIGLAALGLAGQFGAGSSSLRQLVARPATTYVLLAAWLLLLAFSAIPRLFTVKRLLVVMLPYLALMLASRLTSLRPRVTWAIAALGLAATLWMLGTFQREPWREVVATLTHTSAAQPAVAWVDELAVPAFDYYARRTPAEPGGFTWTPLLDADLPALPHAEPPAGGDLWLVVAESPYRDLNALLPAEFHQRYHLAADQHAPGIGLYRYQRRIEPLATPPELPPPSPEALWGLQMPSPLATCR